ncbi:hypothetical protein HDV00_002910 [Rhizophlyctis rosea]|nr:hypothetical protein HDV00_002910 [Rhizophlyctis rosea]
MSSGAIPLTDFLDSVEEPGFLFQFTPTERLPTIVHANVFGRSLLISTDSKPAADARGRLEERLKAVGPASKLEQWLLALPTGGAKKFEGTYLPSEKGESSTTRTFERITLKATRIKSTDYYVVLGTLSQMDQQYEAQRFETTLAGGGGMGRMLREYDWANTPLGPISSWPQSLLSVVSLVMASSFPMALWWGQDLTLIYGDSYLDCAGQKHPELFGKTGKEGWKELWPDVELLARRALAGECCFMEDQMLPMFRHGFEEETYFTWAYIPIRTEDGSIGGLLNPSIETTARVLAERGLLTLRNLSTATATARSIKETCSAAIETLAANEKDVPFAVLYTCSEQSGQNGEHIIRLTLQDTLGVVRGTKAAPEEVVIDTNGNMTPSATWPFDEAYRSQNNVEVPNPETLVGSEVARRGWGDPSRLAVVCPIQTFTDKRHLGCLVIGLNPRRQYNDTYRTFLELLTGQLAASLVAARGYEEEVKRAEGLAALDRAKTAFFSSISHELRTPLTLMLGPLDDALSDTFEPLAQNQRIRCSMVLRNAQRLLRLVNSLLDYSKIEAGRLQASYRQTSLGRLTADLASVFRSAIEKGGVKFKVACEEDLPPVWVDTDMWEKIVFNMIGNAFKFTLSGSITVVLQSSQDRRTAEFFVKDTGVGIPKHEIQRIFERFHRVEGQRGRSFEGTGIGLSLTNELVKLHGGTIDVTSDGVNGSTFRVCLPFGCAHLPQDRLIISENPEEDDKDMDLTYGLALVDEARRWLTSDDDESSSVSAESVSSAANETVMAASSGMRILLADDNRDMRRYVVAILRRWWHVTEVKDGLEAVEMIKKEPFDLVVSDIMMPNLDGFGLLKYLRSRQETRFIPVILLSARAGDEARVDGLNAGADDYLMKPFSAKELVARVRTHLELGKLRAELERRVDERTKELGESERRFKEVSELSPVGIFRTTTDGRFTFLNERWWDISKHPRDQDPEATHFLQRLWQSSMDEAKRLHVEFRWLNDEKGERWCLGEALVQYDDDGQHIGFIGAITDITSRKIYERETLRAAEFAEQQQRQRAEEAEEVRRQQELFIDMICHELRNPLNGIYNNADLLNERLQAMQRDLRHLQVLVSQADQPKMLEDANRLFNHMLKELVHDLEAVEMISLCAKHQKTIADDVLHMSKISMNLLVLAQVDYQPRVEIANILKMFETEVAAKNIMLELKFSSNFQRLNIEWLRGDPTRLAQVLINFLTNAIRFTEKVATARNIVVTVDVSFIPPAKPDTPALDAARRDIPSPSEPHNYLTAGHASDDEEADTWSTISTHTITLRQSRGARDNPPTPSEDDRPPNNHTLSSDSIPLPSASPPGETNGSAAETSSGVYLIISIKDSGVGMTLEEQRQLFRRFAQASPKTYAEFGGSGLGLFISKRLVELQHGDILVESVKGQGTTFTFYIFCEKCVKEAVRAAIAGEEGGGEGTSCITEIGEATVPVRAVPASTIGSESIKSPESPASVASSETSLGAVAEQREHKGGMHLLLVEDNVINQKVLKRQLELLGFSVTAANHGAEALTFLEASVEAGNDSPGAPSYSLILMDLEMPVMDGLECTAQIRDWEATGKLSRRLPIIAVSGNARQEYVTRAMDAGMDDFVTKPYSKKLLDPDDSSVEHGQNKTPKKAAACRISNARPYPHSGTFRRKIISAVNIDQPPVERTKSLSASPTPIKTEELEAFAGDELMAEGMVMVVHSQSVQNHIPVSHTSSAASYIYAEDDIQPHVTPPMTLRAVVEQAMKELEGAPPSEFDAVRVMGDTLSGYASYGATTHSALYDHVKPFLEKKLGGEWESQCVVNLTDEERNFLLPEGMRVAFTEHVNKIQNGHIAADNCQRALTLPTIDWGGTTPDGINHHLRRRLKKRQLLILEKNRNRVNYNRKVVHHLTTNYQYIHGSEFPVEDMVRKQPGQHLHRTNGRAMK